ncbi:MAG: phage portal protein [Alphaproteobacteria bacterium]
MKKQAIKSNLIDRAISYVNPIKGLQRMEARTRMAVYGGYIGAKRDRRQTTNWHTLMGSADNASIYDLPILRDRSRDLLRNAPLACGAVHTVITNVIGTGLKPQSHIDREILKPYLKTEEAMEKFERDAERIFKLWSENKDCDITRSQSFTQMQALVLRSCLESGDVFIVRRFKQYKENPFETTLQVIEADRVDNPNRIKADNIIAGVELNDDGSPAYYHIYDKNPNDLEDGVATAHKVPVFDSNGRRQVLHIFSRTRPDLTRGIPYLAPVIESLKQLDRYSEAEIMAAVISSMFTVFVKTESEEGLAPMSPLPEAHSNKPSRGGDYQMSSGAILDLAPNESIEIADPKRPNQAFDGFVQSVLRQIGVALEIPFEILIKHFTASYSAAQAALVEAWKAFSTRRKWIASDFCQPVYEMVITEAIAKGILHAPAFFSSPFIRSAYLGTEWIGPPRGQIDQLKEIKAAQQRVDLGVSTLAEETAIITGGDWEVKHKQRAKEQRLRVEVGLQSIIDNTTNEETEDE